MLYRTHWLASVAAAGLLLAASASYAQFSLSVSVHLAPPPLLVYQQPAIPASGYLWVPGYWAWDAGGYYWVPGEWVLPPRPGLLWTPGYWGWQDGAYVWHEGYWAPQVGFYGGVDYGYGYEGSGYVGGYWSRGVFYYNDACNHLPPGYRFAHVYHRSVGSVQPGRVSFNGPGGALARPTQRQLAVQREPHVSAVAAQRDQVRSAQRQPHQGTGEREGAGARAAHGPSGEAAPQQSYRYLPERTPERSRPAEPGRAPPAQSPAQPNHRTPEAHAPAARAAPQAHGAAQAHRPAAHEQRGEHGEREPPR